MAVKKLKESLEISQRFNRGDHSLVATSLCSLGCAYDEKGELYAALGYLVKSLEMRKRLFSGTKLVPISIMKILHAQCIQLGLFIIERVNINWP